MKYSAENINLIKALSDAPGPSGFEDAVLEVVRSALEDIAQQVAFFARKEGLEAHARSAIIRSEE